MQTQNPRNLDELEAIPNMNTEEAEKRVLSALKGAHRLIFVSRPCAQG